LLLSPFLLWLLVLLAPLLLPPFFLLLLSFFPCGFTWHNDPPGST
jgi:hypothetical protein